MKIIALDPSSTKTGYAIGHDERTLIECGVLTSGGNALVRIAAMADDVQRLLRQHLPDVVVIEVPSGKTHRRMGKNISGLPIYGMAAGAVYIITRHYVRWRGREHKAVELATPDQNEWTRGTKKALRQRCVAMDFPQYDKRQDPGGDASDAVALMQWFCRERMTCET